MAEQHVEDTVTDHAASIMVQALECRTYDAENQSHRNSLCVVGLLEGVEGDNPTVFTVQILDNGP